MTAYRPHSNSITYDGQSLLLAPSTLTDTAPYVIGAALTHPRPFVVRNMLGTDYPTRAVTVSTRVDPYYLQATGQRAYVDCGGSTDIQNGASGATVIANAEAYWNARKAVGFTPVVVCTVPNGGIFNTSPLQAARAAYNVLVKASTVPSAVADLDACPELQNFNDLTYFQVDTIHPTAAGALVIANCILAALASIGIT